MSAGNYTEWLQFDESTYSSDWGAVGRLNVLPPDVRTTAVFLRRKTPHTQR